MMSLFCAASMLPCGRYYYEPEGGYVGNPWVKFSYQYVYVYLAWIIHHLDALDHYIFQFSQTLVRKSNMYSLRFFRANNSRKSNNVSA
jgi:hypothetical protein